MPDTPDARRAALATVEVLIVDDNAAMRTLVRNILRAIGIVRIRETNEGEDALRLLAMRPADIVLLDQAMPGMSGLDVAKALRGDPAHPGHQSRIIMVTGYGDRAHVAAARDAGIDEFLVKPITTRGLLMRLEAVLARGRAFVDIDGFQGPDRRRRDERVPAGQDRRTADEQLI